jgi:hypothetical protein
VSSIPLADAPAFRPYARRTFAVRTALALALLACVVAAVLVARRPHTQSIAALPTTANAIVVLDLSASISADTYSRIGSTLESLAHSRGRFGLVVFSDQAYEALPPGTPARDLQPLVRYFTLPSDTAPGFAKTFPANPWQDAFSAGTRISTGLELAHRLAVAQRLRHPAVILVSDLDDDPDDVPRVGALTAVLQRDHIPLRVIGLNPSPEDLALFHKLAGYVPITRAGLRSPGAAARDHTPFPWTLVLLTVAVATLLAAGELWGPTLEVDE